ncbi:MAG: ABC transporter permease [Gammaproteobacteria bacterium]|nr:ABC transporter permease [Gammaproteobacteria bacterium]
MPKGALLAVPATVVYGTLFVAPLAFFLVVSFWHASLFEIIPGFSLDNYVKTVTTYPRSIVFTLTIGLSIAALTTLIAFGFAYVIRFKAGRYGPVLLFMALVTLFGGYLVKIYAWKTILGIDGILNSALLGLGLISEPIDLLLYSSFAVVITLTHYLLPLAILPIYGALRGIDDLEVASARDLGASSSRVMCDIILPQAYFGIIAAFAFAYLISAGDYVTPRLVGGTETRMIGNFIESQFGMRMNTPLGAAMSFTTLVLSALVIVAVGTIFRLFLRRR